MTGTAAKHTSMKRAPRGVTTPRTLLAAACLRLLGAPGALGLRPEGDIPDDVSRCCCQGPSPDECRLLRGSQLRVSSNPVKWREPVCPKELGFRKFTRFDFKEIPEPCVNTDLEPEAGIEITVKAYWMRHGWSCANALQAQSRSPLKEKLPLAAKYEAYHHGFYEDPGLTNVAVIRASALGGAVRERIAEQTGGREPLVFSSAMVRAMETALWNFPDSQVRPIPYIAEKGHGPANKPLLWEEQKASKLTRPPTDEDKASHIVFDFNHHDHEDRSGGKKSDYDAFRRYFPRILSKLLAGEQVAAGTEVPVIIVSHSHYMKAYLQCGESDSLDRIPRNNEVWVQTYKVNLGSYDAILDPIACEELFDSGESNLFPLPPELLCAGDVDRCASEDSNFRPQAWLKHDAQACQELGNVGILARDAQNQEPYTKLNSTSSAVGGR